MHVLRTIDQSLEPCPTFGAPFRFVACRLGAQSAADALYFFLGVAPKGADPSAWAANHSPRFSPDEAALITGVRALASLAVDFLAGAGK